MRFGRLGLRFSIVLAAALAVCSMTFPFEAVSKAPLTVVLDPGHFNRDLDGKITKDGAHAVFQGRTVWEGEVTLAVSEFLRAELESRGIKVFATRTKKSPYWPIRSHGYDQKLANVGRAEFANEHNADLFIRIHFDSSNDPKASGFAVYFNDQSDYDKDGAIEKESRMWAKAVSEGLNKAWPLANLGVKRFTRTIYGFKYAKTPSILIEGGFMTNEDDLSVIMDISKRKLLARLIADAIMKRLEAFE